MTINVLKADAVADRTMYMTVQDNATSTEWVATFSWNQYDDIGIGREGARGDGYDVESSTTRDHNQRER